jgi:hypothetical protein
MRRTKLLLDSITSCAQVIFLRGHRDNSEPFSAAAALWIAARTWYKFHCWIPRQDFAGLLRLRITPLESRLA